MKICARCKQEKPITAEFFYPRSDRPGRFHSYCRFCDLAIQRERWKKNPKRLEWQRVWRDKNREHYNVQARSYMNPTKRHVKYLKQRDMVLAQAREKYKKDPKRYYEWTKNWRKNNPEKIRALQRSDNARRRSAEGSYNVEDIHRLWWFQQGLCQYCREPLNPQTFEVDHMTPIIRSGSNWPKNLCLSCGPCNSRKHDQTAEEFYAFVGA